MKKLMRLFSILLMISVFFNGNVMMAKQSKKATLKTKKLTIEVGKKKSIRLKNKKKKAKYTYKSSKTFVAKVSQKGKVTARKVGKAKITVKEKLGKKTKKIGTVTVKVEKKKGSSTAEPTPHFFPPSCIVYTKPTATPTVTPEPSPTPTLTPTPTPKDTPKPNVPEDPRISNPPTNLTSNQSGVSYGKKIKTTYYSTTTGKDRNVIVILPNGYTEEKKYPVLYLFHGGMGDENDWISGNVEKMIGNMIASGEAKEMILVLPNCRCREDDTAANADGFALGHVQSFDNFRNDFKDNLMPFINKTYSVAKGRENTAVAGLSMGGRVSLNIGFSLPDSVGYTGAFSPAYGIFAYTNMGLTETGLFTENTFTLPAEYNGNTLVMINNGLQDTMVKKEPERYHKALDANNVEHIYYTTKGGHDWTVWKHGFYNFARYVFQPKEAWITK